MKISKGLIYILFLGVIACKPTSKTTVHKLTNSDLSTNKGIVYALPETNLNFKVEALKTEIIPGPYNMYAEKLIGISNVPDKAETIWQISNIEISSFNDIDENELYVLNPSGKFNVNLEKLITNNIVLPVNCIKKQSYANHFFGINNTGNDVVFKDLSVTKYIGQEKVTYFKRVQRDSIFAKVPVVKTQSVHKTLAKKAEEAANFIFMIREKRFELLSGLADYYPDGEAMKIALAELNRLETEYLNLFIGKKYTSTYSAEFEFSPTEKSLNQPNILFRFNENKGVLPANNLSGRPIIIELKKQNNTKYLIGLNKITNSDADYLFYRLPELTQINVLDGSSLIAKRKIQISQFGNVIPFPIMFFMENESFIEFYQDKNKQ